MGFARSSRLILATVLCLVFVSAQTISALVLTLLTAEVTAMPFPVRFVGEFVAHQTDSSATVSKGIASSSKLITYGYDALVNFGKTKRWVEAGRCHSDLVGLALGYDARGLMRVWHAVNATKPGGLGLTGPGPYAGESVPAENGPSRKFTPGERAALNETGSETGCHRCGTTDPGTKSRNFIPDHQPPNALNPPGSPRVFYPRCKGCSWEQLQEIARIQRAAKKVGK